MYTLRPLPGYRACRYEKKLGKYVYKLLKWKIRKEKAIKLKTSHLERKKTRNQSNVLPNLESWFQNEFVLGINKWLINWKRNNSCFPFSKYVLGITIGTTVSTEDA